jgi:hypothetical protein
MRDGEIATVLHTISPRVIRHVRKWGDLEVDSEDVVPTGYDPTSDEDPELARTIAASVQQRIACGERAGQKMRRMGLGFGDEGERSTLTGTRCASVGGFSLHANTHVPAHRRDQLERLLRSTARGAVALERLDINADGDLLYTFTCPWADGTTGIKLSPLEFLEKLVALVPLPRQHLLRYGGCLAPHSKLRLAIIPTSRQQGIEEPEGASATPNWSWALLLKRVFAIDMERCPVCQQGTMRIIAAITEVRVIRKILRCEASGRPTTHHAGAARRVRMGFFQPITLSQGRGAPAAVQLWVRCALIPICINPFRGHSRSAPADHLRAFSSMCHPCHRLTA